MARTFSFYPRPCCDTIISCCADTWAGISVESIHMRRLLCCLAVMLLAAPAFRADDKKPPTPKERYDALEKEYAKALNDLVAEMRKTKDDERQKLIERYHKLGEDFADKF